MLEEYRRQLELFIETYECEFERSTIEQQQKLLERYREKYFLQAITDCKQGCI